MARVRVQIEISSGVLAGILAFLAASILTVSSARAQPAAPGVYSVGRAGSLVGFTIHGRALLPITREGRFKEFAGEVSYDPGRPADTHIELTVYTGSIDMDDRDQDRVLMSGDFFDVEHFPTMHFAGSVADVKPDGTLTVAGDLTIRGVTKRISAPVAFRPPDAQPAAVFETNFQIDRSDFGLDGATNWRGFNVSIANDVQIHMTIAAVENSSAPLR
jgi:polyisoprenoid-binding protein YceI